MDESRYREAERALWDSVGATPTERHLDLVRSGTSVRVLEVGDGPPVVFVHGASNAATSWASLAVRLGGFRCVLVDRPGCGLSPPLDAPLADMAQLDVFADALVVDVLDAMGIDEAAVVGTSFGGYFVLRAAAAHPDRICRVVELSWPFGAPADAAPLMLRVGSVPVMGRLMARVPPNKAMVRSLLKQIGLRRAVESGRFGAVEIAWFLSLLRDTDTMRNEIDAAPRVMTLRGFNDDTLLEPSLLSGIDTPVYFLWGDEDPAAGPDSARRFVDLVPGATLEIMARAGHAPWMDDPDHVAARVGAFLRG